MNDTFVEDDVAGAEIGPAPKSRQDPTADRIHTEDAGGGWVFSLQSLHQPQGHKQLMSTRLRFHPKNTPAKDFSATAATKTKLARVW